MIPQQPSNSTDQPPDALPSARPAGALQQLAQRVLALVKGIWTLLSTRRPVRIVVGLILLFVGIIGLFLPVLQGLAMIVAALAILRKDIPLAERVWQRWIMPYEQRCRQWLHTVRQRRAARKAADKRG